MQYQGRKLRVLLVYPTFDDKAKGAIREAWRDVKITASPPESTSSERFFKALEYAHDEIMQVVNLLDAHLLTGKRATIHGLIDVLASGWDIVWLVTHGTEAGWFLSDGLVNASELTTLVRASGTFLTVMNTCSSEQVAQAAARELGTAFICTVSPVPDRQAYITGVIFAQKLAAGLDYVAAYHAAKPGQNSVYVLIEARDWMPPNESRYYGPQGQMPDAETIFRFIRSVETLTKSVADLEIIVNGSTYIGNVGLKNRMDEVSKKLDAIEDKLDRLERTRKIRDWVIGGLFTIVVILLAILGAYVMSQYRTGATL